MEKKQHVVEVVRHEGPIVLPKSITIAQAIEVLHDRLSYDEEQVAINREVDAFPWDGAIALTQALQEQFGYAMQKKGAWWEELPQKLEIPCGPNGQTVQVAWGKFQLPNIAGFVATSVSHNSDNRVRFKLSAVTKHVHEEEINKLFARTAEIAMSQSILRGKAFRIRFSSDDGSSYPIPIITFPVIEDHPVIFNRALETSIKQHILTLIEHTQVVRSANIPIKRGILLAGDYGTGKTLTANRIAILARHHGWTFMYAEAKELREALVLAKMYQPAIVFAEDIDRVVGEERTDAVNEIINLMDGVDTKSSEIMVVLTSNHPEKISPAMMRRGRIDLALRVTNPDAETVTRLIRHYAKDLLDVGSRELLGEVGHILADQNPATIREVVERTKLQVIDRTGRLGQFTHEDLRETAVAYMDEQRHFKHAPVERVTAIEELGRGLGHRLGNMIKSAAEKAVANGNGVEAK